MAKKIRIEMNSKGIQQLLKSDDILDALEGQGRKIAAKAGPGYAAVAGSKGKTRARVFVETATQDAADDNARNATLLRAVMGSGGSDYVKYTTKSGKTRWATQAQVDNWTRGRR